METGRRASWLRASGGFNDFDSMLTATVKGLCTCRWQTKERGGRDTEIRYIKEHDDASLCRPIMVCDKERRRPTSKPDMRRGRPISPHDNSGARLIAHQMVTSLEEGDVSLLMART